MGNGADVVEGGGWIEGFVCGKRFVEPLEVVDERGNKRAATFEC